MMQSTAGLDASHASGEPSNTALRIRLQVVSWHFNRVSGAWKVIVIQDLFPLHYPFHMQGDYAFYYALVDVAPTQTYSVTLNPYGTAKIDLYATTDGT